ncbi:MAG TPA: hypothetical protein VK992_05505, partial [Candidatus Caenarcaniphilales bacterium]|nr:hypothetical protein [Candidatus Caenarcaniphilales bacterium]
ASFAALVAGPALEPDRRLLALSRTMTYGGLVAAGATVLYATLGWARRRRAVPTALALSIPLGVLMGSAGITGNLSTAVGCAAPSTTMSGRVELTARAIADDDTVAEATMTGQRSGTDERWLARLESDVTGSWDGRYQRAGDDASFRREESGEEQTMRVDVAATGPTLDGRVAELIDTLAGPGVEDRGVETVAAQPARRCRRLISGAQALDGFEPLRWLIGQDPLTSAPALEIWRGELDWWTNSRGELVAARAHVGGLPSDAWPARALRGLLRVELHVLDAGTPQPIGEPLP